MRFPFESSSVPRGVMVAAGALAVALLGPGTGRAQGPGPGGAPGPAPAAVATPDAGATDPNVNSSPTAPIPSTDPANRGAPSTAQAPGPGPGAKPTAAKASSGIYRSTGPGGAVHYGAVETPGAMEVTRESIRNRTVSAPPLDSVTPEYRAEVADTCQTWRDRLAAWRTARAIYVREDDGRVRLLSAPERAHTIGRFTGIATYWCRPAAAEKIQVEYRLAEARRLAAAERAAALAPRVIKVERR